MAPRLLAALTLIALALPAHGEKVRWSTVDWDADLIRLENTHAVRLALQMGRLGNALRVCVLATADGQADPLYPQVCGAPADGDRALWLTVPEAYPEAYDMLRSAQRESRRITLQIDTADIHTNPAGLPRCAIVKIVLTNLHH